jgi:hypothetical protein
MLEQMHLVKKVNHLKTLYQKLKKRLYRATDQISSKQKQHKLNPDLYEFQPSDQVGTAPRLKNVRLSDGTAKAQNQVWDNEDASMQDKSYIFDEVTTDVNFETGHEFELDEESRLENSLDNQ